jgi:hypothetical protein
MKPPPVHRSIAAASIALAALAWSDPAPAAEKEWYDSFSVEFRRRPTATLFYGWGATSLEDIRTPLTDPRVLDLQLGGSRTTREDESPELLRYKNSYLSLALYAPRLGSIEPVPGEASFDQFKLHIADVKGYGYELWAPDNELILYNGGTFGWTWMELVTPSPFAEEQQFLQTFTDGVRFGTSSAAGLRVNPIPRIALDVRVDRDLVFRRHLVAAWGLSALIEGAAGWGVDEFVSSVMKSTPEAVPVVSFLLRGGLAYGFSELRRSNMNWPFTSEPALVNDAFKVGVSFMF